MTSGIDAWLDRLGLGKYGSLFAENEIDLDTLPYVTDEALEKIGVALGARLKILGAIAAQSASGPAVADGSETQPVASVASERGAERRHMTVMFCDLVGSTALSGRLDPEEMRLVIQAYQNAVAGEATRFEGHVAKFMGDGVLVYFGWPRAHEDDAERAVRAALSIMQALTGLAAPDGAPLSARIGISTGLVVVGDLIGEGASQEEAVVGDTPNLAARLQTAAAPGQVVVGEATRSLLGENFELADLGAQNLKGIGAPVTAFSVLGARALESRFDARAGLDETPLVGREQELSLLLERWRQAKAGEGQMILLTGEPGIGKSRITRGAVDAVAAEPHFRIVYQCSPYHSDSALYPTIQQLSRAAEFAQDDSADDKLDKLEALINQAGGDGSAVAPLFAHLLGVEFEDRYGKLNLSPEQQRARTLRALSDQLTGLAEQRPVLVIVEDAHWSDPTTLELLELCLDRVSTAKVLMLVTARPTFDHGFGGHPIVTRLTLNRLGREQIAGIVNRLSGGSSLSDELVNEIMLKTDGVPLFVEELTKAVLESGDTGIPASLHDSLMSRLDRIPDVKAVAQIAATIGRTFDYKLLRAITDQPEAELVACLDKLAEAELAFCRGRPPEATYTFKHALVRDAAYESLLKSRRQELHGKIAEALEAEFPETAEAQPELLGHHHAQAGALLAAGQKWLLAGDRSARRAANREAIAQLKRGLDLVNAIDEGPETSRLELDLLMTLGGCLRTLKGWNDKETVDTVLRARSVDQQLGGTEYRGTIGIGVYSIHLLRGEMDDALKAALELLRLAGDEMTDVAPYAGHRAAAPTLVHMGRFAEAREHALAGLADYDPAREHADVPRLGYYSGVTLHSYLSHALWHLGFADQALRSLEQSLALTEELQHPPSQAFALFQALYQFGHTMRCDTADLRDHIARFEAIGGGSDFAVWSAVVESEKAYLSLKGGGPAGELDVIRRNITWWKANAGVLVQPALLTIQARGEDCLGRRQEALSSVDAAIDLGRRSGERLTLAESYRLKGHLLEPDGFEAQEACYLEALTVAHDQGSRTMELRIATDLARLWADQRERGRAQDLLAPLYGWFTEGFDTSDLKRAKSLLEELT